MTHFADNQKRLSIFHGVFVRLGNIVADPLYFFNKLVLADRAVLDLTNSAGYRFAVIHMEIEFYRSIGVASDQFDHLLHLFVSGSQLEIPR